MPQECQTSYEPVLCTSIWKVERGLVTLMGGEPGTLWADAYLGILCCQYVCGVGRGPQVIIGWNL